MFWDEVEKHYEAGSAHQFLLHFNVDDLIYDEVYGYLPTVNYLMEQLNALGCDLVLGYNMARGVYLPNIGQWRNRQKMLELIPQDHKEEDVKTQRPRINSRLAFHKPHEDPFFSMEPVPSPDLRRRLKQLMEQGRTKIGLVIDMLEQLIPNHSSLADVVADETQLLFNQIQNWAPDLEIRRKKHIILLVTRNTADIHPNLTVQPEIPMVVIPFPDYEERSQFIERLHDVADGASQMRKTLGNNREREALARETVGLNLFGVHDVVRQAVAAEQKAGGEPVLRYRRESLRTFSHSVLELSDTHPGPSDDGWYVMRTIRDIADGVKNQDLRRVPRGMLVLGPPGTSKAYAARVLAGEANIPLVQLRYANQVGEVTLNINENGNSYERNLTTALNYIRSIVPAVVFMDDIEQASPHTAMHPDELNQTMPHALINAISDASLHGSVIWVGASQRPDLMPQIFRRYGIFDTKLIMLPPNSGGRVAILRIFCQGQTAGNINFQALVGNSEKDGLTWRDLLIIVQRANNFARRNNRDRMTENDLRQALNDFIPDYSREMQTFMGLLALREANSRMMIPDGLLPEYQEFVEQNQIDKTGINKRLMELSNQLGLHD